MENMNLITEGPPPPSPTLTELIASLEQAIPMAKQLPATTDQTHLQIYSFYQAHLLLSSSPTTQFPPSSAPAPPPSTLAAAEKSLSSATGSEPMQLGNDGDENELEAEGEESFFSKTSIDKVEEKMRDCFINNKRPKWLLSPSSVAVAEERRLYEDGFVGVQNFDPHGSKLRALDLVLQFHG